MSWVPNVRKTLGGNILFFHMLIWWAPTVILSTYFCRFLLFVDHVDNARGRRRGFQRVDTAAATITTAGEAVEVGMVVGEDGGHPQLLLGGAGLLGTRHAGWTET